MPVLSLSIGSNIDARNNILRAVAVLRELFGDLRCSSVYETEAVGFDGENFLNLVVAIATELPLTDIVAMLKQIEDKLGRDRKQPRFSGRTMDIDILTYGANAGDDAGLQLPRAEITQNAFVLCPLAELLPAQVHAGTGKSFAQLWQEYDKARQKLWPIEFDLQARPN